jgi:hypothetical protein
MPNAFFTGFAAKLTAFNGSLAAKFRTTQKTIFTVEIGALASFGFTMMQIGEHLVAIMIWVFLAFLGIEKIFQSNLSAQNRTLAIIERALLIFFVLAGCSILIVITNFHRRNEPWSNLAGLWEKKPKNPDITAVILGIKPQSGNAVGCTIYSLQISPADVPIDKLEMKLQFPMDVHEFKVGLGFEYPENKTAGIFSIGRGSDGECDIKQGMVDHPAIKSVQLGPGMIEIRGNDIPAGSEILGAFVLYMNRRSFSPTSLFIKGTYEYMLSGAEKTADVKVIDKGVSNAK